MRVLFLILTLGMLCYSNLYSQSFKKSSYHKGRSSNLTKGKSGVYQRVNAFTNAYPRPLKGPRAKNLKPWEKAKRPQHRLPITFSKTTVPLKGPKAKNKKPWPPKGPSRYYVLRMEQLKSISRPYLE